MVIVVNINRKWMWGISSLILSLFSVVFQIHNTFIFLSTRLFVEELNRGLWNLHIKQKDYCMTYTLFFRLQNSPYFCVFKYARAVKQKVLNEDATLYRFLYWFWEKNRLFCSLLILALWVPATMCSAWSTPWDKGRGGEGRGWGATPGSAANVLIQFLFFSFSSFDRFSYFRTLIIIMIIIINIRSFHAVSFLKDRADHFKVVGLKNLAVFRHLSCICSPS